MFTCLSSNVQDDRTSLLPNVYKMYIKTNFVAKKVCKLQAENSVNMCMYHSAIGSASVRNPGVRMALSLVSYCTCTRQMGRDQSHWPWFATLLLYWTDLIKIFWGYMFSGLFVVLVNIFLNFSS